MGGGVGWGRRDYSVGGRRLRTARRGSGRSHPPAEQRCGCGGCGGGAGLTTQKWDRGDRTSARGGGPKKGVAVRRLDGSWRRRRAQGSGSRAGAQSERAGGGGSGEAGRPTRPRPQQKRGYLHVPTKTPTASSHSTTTTTTNPSARKAACSRRSWTAFRRTPGAGVGRRSHHSASQRLTTSSWT